MDNSILFKLPPSLVADLAAWGRLTANVFSRIHDLQIESPLASVPEDERWFWTPEIQEQLRTSEEDIAKGNIYAFMSAKEAVHSLHDTVQS